MVIFQYFLWLIFSFLLQKKHGGNCLCSAGYLFRTPQPTRFKANFIYFKVVFSLQFLIEFIHRKNWYRAKIFTNIFQPCAYVFRQVKEYLYSLTYFDVPANWLSQMSSEFREHTRGKIINFSIMNKRKLAYGSQFTFSTPLITLN